MAPPVNALAELEGLGLSFISLRDNLDLSTPSGQLMFHVVGAMAQFERASGAGKGGASEREIEKEAPRASSRNSR